jgi:hypothetical protein
MGMMLAVGHGALQSDMSGSQCWTISLVPAAISTYDSIADGLLRSVCQMHRLLGIGTTAHTGCHLPVLGPQALTAMSNLHALLSSRFTPPILCCCLHCRAALLLCCRWTAAASRPILLKQCLQLPKPLWKEVMECMGGDYATAAREDIVE